VGHDHGAVTEHRHAARRPAVGTDLVDVLHARGLRSTPQRAQVLAAVRGLGHATPERIAQEVDGVDVTTVYRTLELLEDLGLVAHTHLDHGAPSYRPSEDAHIHVVCHSCSAVIDVPNGIADTLVQRLSDERGFSVDLAHFTVFGTCESCGDSPSPAE
jgi:Fur family ferric uptake transcriptional regulator